MNEIIRKRKSIRNFEKSPLEEEILLQVKRMFSELIPLYPKIKYEIKIGSKAKGMFGVDAPHYLFFYSENDEGYLENIGFIGQQMDLFFAGNGIGSCWLGMAKPEETGEHPFIISMAFGKPAEPLYRDISEFKRKSLEEISEGDDIRLEAARLAPSGINAQNWYFIAESGKIHCFRRKPTISIAGTKLGSIDMGIALCHIAIESEKFSFVKESVITEGKKLIYMGTVV